MKGGGIMGGPGGKGAGAAGGRGPESGTDYWASFPHPSVPSPSLRVPGTPAALPPPRPEPGPQGAL